MLINARVYLRLLEKKDLPYRVEWINDAENIQNLLFDWPTSLAKTEKWFSNIVMDSTRVNFSIIDRKTDTLIGMTGLLNIDTKNRIAQLYITIGNKSYRGKKLPDEIIPLVLGYGFGELGLVKIYLYTLPNNEYGRRVYERNGFQADGVLRQHVFCRGKHQDLHVHSILKSEWAQNHNE